jgi:hypothetical protein
MNTGHDGSMERCTPAIPAKPVALRIDDHDGRIFALRTIRG